jgi:hypothetical protein
MARAWPLAEIARHAGTDEATLQRLLAYKGKPTPGLLWGIAGAYERLWDAQPSRRTEAEREAADAALQRARRMGWAPPMAWDDDLIDDPVGRPADGWKPRRSPWVRHSADLAEDTAFLREHGGYRHASTRELALRLGVSAAWLQSALSRVRRAQQARLEVTAG